MGGIMEKIQNKAEKLEFPAVFFILIFNSCPGIPGKGQLLKKGV
jgi:hypothetical protein